MPPANLKTETLMLTSAELPGSGRFWALYERLDNGPVAHVRYAGLLPCQDGETPEALLTRARAQLAALQGD
jgi:hypothetical protein